MHYSLLYLPQTDKYFPHWSSLTHVKYHLLFRMFSLVTGPLLPSPCVYMSQCWGKGGKAFYTDFPAWFRVSSSTQFLLLSNKDQVFTEKDSERSRRIPPFQRPHIYAQATIKDSTFYLKWRQNFLFLDNINNFIKKCSVNFNLHRFSLKYLNVVTSFFTLLTNSLREYHI